MAKWPITWEMRTSTEYPLQIDWISHVNFKGKIGLTLCPGKYQPISWTGGWNRDLNYDLETILENKVSTVISLIDKEEMIALRVEEIGNMISQKGMTWIHLPWEDTTAPDQKWVDQFLSILDSVIDMIVDGKTIVIHCKGGLGRAGTCAALILYALGLDMYWAIDLVRMRRSKECINPEQYVFLEGFNSYLENNGLKLDRKKKPEVRL